MPNTDDNIQIMYRCGSLWGHMGSATCNGHIPHCTSRSVGLLEWLLMCFIDIRAHWYSVNIPCGDSFFLWKMFQFEMSHETGDVIKNCSTLLSTLYFSDDYTRSTCWDWIIQQNEREHISYWVFTQILFTPVVWVWLQGWFSSVQYDCQPKGCRLESQCLISVYL